MKPRWAILFFCLLIQNFSCKKENLIDAGAAFHRVKTEPAGPVRVFSRFGEIMDASILQRFTVIDSFLINYYSNRSSFDSITIVNDNEAKLDRSPNANYNYSYHFNEIKFTGKDTITGYSYLEVYTRSLSYFLAFYKPEIYKEYIFSSTAGAYNFAYRSRNEFRLLKDHDQLKAPWIVAVLHSRNSGSRPQWLQNTLDPNFYQYIDERDTVVLRENYLIYEK